MTHSGLAGSTHRRRTAQEREEREEKEWRLGTSEKEVMADHSSALTRISNLMSS